MIEATQNSKKLASSIVDDKCKVSGLAVVQYAAALPQIQKDQPVTPSAGVLESVHPRFHVEGKFIYQAGQKFYLKGTTYGTFAPNLAGELYPEPWQVEKDFRAMAANKINSVRVYTVPPRWLLDLAQTHELRVLVGIPWDQHLAFTEDSEVRERIERTCEDAVTACCHHPAVLGYSLGNEIKGNVVRWLGRRRVEKFLERLYHIVKNKDPEALVTYVNFPTTEYLNLDFLDFISFNVYLESKTDLNAYLARLHTVAADKPLLLAEVGMDSLRNGELLQAQTMKWQIDTVFQAGCAGTFVYAWTDEWFTEGHAIEDWDFGLTSRDRIEKPALSIVRKQFTSAPFDADVKWPMISVVVCSYNGEATIAQSIEFIQRMDYPNFEVIVIDDGSTDSTARIAEQFEVRLVSTPNRGLSNARNTGWEMANGEIVAYCDDDAYPDVHWLRYVAIGFRAESVGAVGGPNLPPQGDGLIADCVAASPGSPMEVLISDTRAEHIPGCNMSIRRSLLEKLGGFDAQFRSAGDDVDMCWRILQSGHEIGFHAGAMNWHHRRNTVSSYLSQQKGYGRAEALLAQKWPEKYNVSGYIEWQGSIYGKGVTRSLSFLNQRVYSGVLGSAPFQRLYKSTDSSWASLLLIPECLVLLVLLMPVALAGLWVTTLAPASTVFAGLSVLLVLQSLINGFQNTPKPSISSLSAVKHYIKRFGVTSFLHIAQPIYRLKGRLATGLTPFFKRTRLESSWRTGVRILMSGFKGEHWEGRNVCPFERLDTMYTALRKKGLNAQCEKEYSHWDGALSVLPLSAAKLKLMVEQYDENVELVKYRIMPTMTKNGLSVFLLFLAMSGILHLLGSIAWAGLFAFSALVVVSLTALGSFFAMSELAWQLEHAEIHTSAQPDHLA